MLNSKISWNRPKKPFSKFSNIASQAAIFLISFYRLTFSAFLGGHCRFEPSCSSYSQQAFLEFGFWKGLRLSFLRLSRCHPWGSSGFDPVNMHSHRSTKGLR